MDLFSAFELPKLLKSRRTSRRGDSAREGLSPYLGADRRFSHMETRYDKPRLAAVSGMRSRDGGADRDRTGDLLRAKQALSQLSYSPLRLTSSPAALLLIARLAGHESPAQAS